MVVEVLAERHGFRLRDRKKYSAEKGSIGDETVVIMEPLTFMNISGDAVREGMRRFGFETDELIVVHDDLDLPPGRVKIKLGGGAGGHNGIISVIERTGTEDFVRVKVGIGKPPGENAERYVLSRFSPDESKLVKGAIERAADAVEEIIAEGPSKAMNSFNQRQE
jgi:PTH1 family peptidyl-tRNA hydrolase